MDSLYIKKNEARNGIRTFNTKKLKYTYSWFDGNAAARSSSNRRSFLINETVNVYPDTTVWVKDFNYSYNDPMHQDYFFHPAYQDYPVVGVNWYQAQAFCNWRTKNKNDKMRDKKSFVSVPGFRLPTEAEWEYACRANTKTAYSFGENLELLGDYAWFKTNSEEKYHKVGQKNPNAWGLYDMHGNVSEWTLDQYDSKSYYRYLGQNVSNPYEKPTKLYPRVVKGGSWMNSSYRLRSASRQGSSKRWKKQDPQIPRSIWWHTDAQFVGFRIIRPKNTPQIKEQNEYWNN